MSRVHVYNLYRKRTCDWAHSKKGPSGINEGFYDYGIAYYLQ